LEKHLFTGKEPWYETKALKFKVEKLELVRQGQSPCGILALFFSITITCYAHAREHEVPTFALIAAILQLR
jgi:hypothetical protein